MKLNKFAYLYSKPLGNHTLKITKIIPGNLLKKTWKYHGILSVRKSGNPEILFEACRLFKWTGFHGTGKSREFGCSFFPEGGICHKILKNIFLHGKFTSYTGNFELLKIKAYSKTGGGIQLQYFGFEASFGLRDISLMEWSFCNRLCKRLCCIWDCGLECILVVVYHSLGSGSRINVILWGWTKTGKMLKILVILPW